MGTLISPTRQELRQRIPAQAGMALMSVLTVLIVMGMLSAMMLRLVGKEKGITAVGRLGVQSLYVAESGAVSARAALMALMNANPIGSASLHPSLDATKMNAWYAGGSASGQRAFDIFDYLVVDGLQYSVGGSPLTDNVTFYVNWALPQARRKLQVAAGGAPSNTLGPGSYTGTVVITRRLAPHPSCAGGGGFGIGIGIGGAPSCYIHNLAPDTYEYNYSYAITADSLVPPRARRRITLSGDFSIIVRRRNFAQYALFTDVHTTASGGAIYFTNEGFYDGPVHTNGQFRFNQFPKFGTPDPNTPCDPGRNGASSLTSAHEKAWFYNSGSPVEKAATENVVSGVRRDAPVVPDCTVGNLSDDADNPAANFRLKADKIPIPPNGYSQKGASVGRWPGDTSDVKPKEIRDVIPELPNTGAPVPAGIYVPVVDTIPNGVSDTGEPLAGGIYVQGNLDLLLLNDNSNNGYYELRQGGQTVQMEVNRAANTTTVTNSAWPSPTTRTFTGVPKGWQTLGNTNAAIIYVDGNIVSLKGMLEEKEQTTIVASGHIDITDHLRYENPPVVTDPNDNPINVLGLYSADGDIRIAPAAPNDVEIHAVMMAGTNGGFKSSVNVTNPGSGSPRGSVHLIGGIIQEFYGQFGTFNSDGSPKAGYGRDFRFDRRMARGFAPPYFPSTSEFELVQGKPLAGARPVWREAAP